MKKEIFFLLLLLCAERIAFAQWQNKANLITARRQHCAVAHPNGKIYLWGGWNGSSLLASLSVYTPASDSWASGANAPLAARGSSYAVGSDNFVYQLSGHSSSGKTTSCYRYNTISNTWASIAACPNAVWESSAIGYNNKIYVFGGEAVISGNALSSNYVQIYDIATNSWSMGSSMPVSLMQHKAVRYGNAVYVFGGRTSSTPTVSTLSNAIYKYSLLSGTWSTLGETLPAGEKNSFGACLGNDNFIYLVGGKNNSTNDAGPFRNTVNIFDPSTELFKGNAMSLQYSLAENTCVSLASGVYAMGGSNGVALSSHFYLATCKYYIDNDGDGYGDPSTVVTSCTPVPGYTYVGGDCQDAASSIHPFSMELINGVDDDCDGLTDEYDDVCAAAPLSFGLNGPYSNVNSTIQPNEPQVNRNGCTAPNSWCTGTNALINNTIWFRFTAPSSGRISVHVSPKTGFDSELALWSAVNCSSVLSDGVTLIAANDDSTAVNFNAWIAPVCLTPGQDYYLQLDGYNTATNSAIQILLIDEGITSYVDADGDGYGNSALSTTGCSVPSGNVLTGGDCADNNSAIHPGAAEACNGLDDDCDGLIDEAVLVTYYADNDGDGYGTAAATISACAPPSGYVTLAGDCNDSNPGIHPGAVEVCNGIDDDCNSMIDDGLTFLTYYRDADMDNYGNPLVSMSTCDGPPAGYVTDATDCNDGMTSVHPAAVELCNGIDDDCDGQVDEGFVYSTAASHIMASTGTVFCEGTMTELSLNGGLLGSGAQWVWYAGGCGSGTPAGYGNSIQVTPAYTGSPLTYYVRAEGTCNSTPCTSIELTLMQPPQFTVCPSNINLGNAYQACGRVVTFTPTVIGYPIPDLSHQITGAFNSTGSGSGSGLIFNRGLSHVFLQANNVCGTAQCNFDVEVSDTSAPAIAGCDTTFHAVADDGQWGTHVNWTLPVISDNCGVASTSISPAPGSFFTVGEHVITYQANDSAGNSASCTSHIVVTPPPLFTATNLSIFADDINIFPPHPAPSSPIDIYATIHNNSLTDASNFHVRLTDMNSNINYPDTLISLLSSNDHVTLHWSVLSPSVASIIPFRVSIDPINTLPESNEFDNEAQRLLINGNIPLAGDIIVATNVMPSAATIGSPMQICGSAHYTELAAQLSDSSVAGAAYTIHIVETGEDIHGVTNALGQFCVSHPGENTAGIYHFKVTVTDFTLSGDTTGDYTLTAFPGNYCPKDLSVRMDLNPNFLCNDFGQVTVGQNISGVVHVYNNCAPIMDSFKLIIQHPASTLQQIPITIPSISPGQVLHIPFQFVCDSVGSSYIAAIVDYNDSIAEANEENNTAVQSIHVILPLPDLNPELKSKRTHYQCQPIKVHYTIANNGGVASGSFNCIFDVMLGNVLMHHEVIPHNSIPARCSDPVEIQFTLPVSGDYTFKFFVDTPSAFNAGQPGVGQVAEILEFNNASVTTHKILDCQTDLAIGLCSSTDIKPINPQIPGMVEISTMIENIGQRPVTDSFTVNVLIGNSIHTSVVHDTISPGQHIRFVKSVPAPAYGNHQFTVQIDTSSSFPESVKYNNTVSGNLCWDFEPVNHRCNASQIAMKGVQSVCHPGVFTIDLINHGYFEASSVEVFFEISGPGIPGWYSLGSSNTFMDFTCGCPKEISHAPGFYFPQTGLFHVRITVDPNAIYSECNENNNQIILPVLVVETPDYAVYSEFIQPSDLNPDINESVSIALSYTNLMCEGVQPVELHLSADELPLDSLPAQALASMAVGTYQLPQTWYSFVPGVHVFKSSIDHDGGVNEADELNNIATRAIIVGGVPNLLVTALNCSNIHPLDQELIQITGSFKNSGKVGADAQLEFLYKNAAGIEFLIEKIPVHLSAFDSSQRTTTWLVNDPEAILICRLSQSQPLEFDLSNNEKTLTLNPMSLLVQNDGAPCFGDPGKLKAVIHGGRHPFYIEWSDGQTGDSVMMPAGNYHVMVHDANENTVSTFFTVTEPNALQASCSAPPIACSGDSVEVVVTASGGTSPYVGTGQFSKHAGIHSFSITDLHGCIATAAISLSEPDVLLASYMAGDILCHGESVAVDIAATGGTPPYLNTGQFNQPAGSHLYTVTDNNGCEAAVQVTLTEPSALVASAIHGDVLCHGGETSVMISASGGKPPYSGVGLFMQQAGTTVYTVTDSSGCQASVSVNLTEPDPLIAVSTSGSISCFGGSASIQITANGGTPAYSGIGTFQQFAGTQTYQVIDMNGCQAETSVTLTQPGPLLVTAVADEIACAGGSATIQVSATGGSSPYTGIGSFIRPAGNYTFTVIDNNGCTAGTGVSLIAPAPLLVSISAPPILTNGGNTNVTVNASGGRPPYTGTGIFTSYSGTYTFTVMDSSSCSASATITLTDPGNPSNDLVLSARAFLQGPFDTGTMMMHDSLRTKGLIPLIEPYTGMPYLKPLIGESGGTSVPPAILEINGPNAIVDWILIEMRHAGNPANIVATKRALIQRDGDIVSASDGMSPVHIQNLAAGDYYVGIKHRNHLGVMTQLPLHFSILTPVFVDFTSPGPVYTNPYIVNPPRKTIGTTHLLWSADANTNKNVKYNGNANDKEKVLSALGGTAFINNIITHSYRQEDLNLDGKILYNGSDNDRVIILNNVGVSNPNSILYQHTPN